MNKKDIYIYSFYRFKRLHNINRIKIDLDELIKKFSLLGTILISDEGINGSISGNINNLEKFFSLMKRKLRIKKLSLKISNINFTPFSKSKIRIKKEIVSIGDRSIMPEKKTGKYIKPTKWDQVITNKKYIVIDTRNNYEIKIGSFKNSINPNIKSFREFPRYIKDQKIDKEQHIAMFCTGGIRCEKASSYLISNGYKNVYQLDGGILNYLEFKKNKKKNSWKGECFVFDKRVAVDGKLNRGSYDQCYGCRSPITDADKKLTSYIKGVQCIHCHNKRTVVQKNRSKMRQSQIDKNLNN